MNHRRIGKHHRAIAQSPASQAKPTLGGRAGAASLEALYGRLRGLAAHMLRSERPGHTLQATALVHEALLRMGEVGEDAGARPSAELYAQASRAIRQVLIDHARAKGTIKRGRNAARAALELETIAGASSDQELAGTLALDEAVSRLALVDAQAAEVVRLRFFGGLEAAHTAAALGISERTVKRALSFAREWLRADLTRRNETDD